MFLKGESVGFTKKNMTSRSADESLDEEKTEGLV